MSRWAIFLLALLKTLLARSPAMLIGATSEERAPWKQAERAGTLAAYDAYLGRFPAGTCVNEAISALVNCGTFVQTALGNTARVPGQRPARRPVRA